MPSFPKRYKIKDLHYWGEQGVQKSSRRGAVFSPLSLPATQTLHAGNFYALYLRDFFLRFTSRVVGKPFLPLLFFHPKWILSMYQAREFFQKKGQILSQVGTHKLLRYLDSQQQKKITLNKKAVSSYFWEHVDILEYDWAFFAFVQEVFARLRKEKKISYQKTVSYWSIDLQTTIPSHQISFALEKVSNYTIKYFVETKNDVLPVCALEPDLIFWDVALLVHPQDKRYRRLIWKKAIIPIVNRPIPIIGDDKVDISKDNGIKRVNPCSDASSIALAEQYKLPLDRYVFDTSGNYTEYAGEYQWKSRKEFYGNILQFLEDISNLGAAYEEQVLVPYATHSWERLAPFLVDEIVLDVQSEKERLLSDSEYHVLFSGCEGDPASLIDTVSIVCNRQVPRWMSIPLLKKGEKYELFEISSFLEGKRPSLQYCFDYVVLCLLRDRLIVQTFDYGLLFSLFQKYEKRIQGYLSAFPTPSKTFLAASAELLHSIKNLPQDVSLASLEALIEKSDLLVFQEGMLSIAVWKGAVLSTDTFDEDLLSSLFIIFLIQQGTSLDRQLFLEKWKCSLLLQHVLLQLLLLNDCMYDAVVYYLPLLDKKWQRFSYQSASSPPFLTLLDTYGSSALKLALLVQKSVQVDTISFYDVFLRQFWNGARYFFSQDTADYTLASAWDAFNKKADPRDVWLIWELQSLYQEVCSLSHHQELLDVFPKVQLFIQRKLLWWYLEMQKISPTQAKNPSLFIVFSLLFVVLASFVPEYIHALLYLVRRELLPMELFPFSKERSTNSILMYDIFDTIYVFKQKLAIKKHQHISLFIKADPNSLLLFEEHQPILEKIFHIDSITFVRLHENDPGGYQQEMFNGITIGIKPSTELSEKKNSLSDLEFQYAQQLEYLEYLRIMISNMSVAWIPEIQITEKRAEMEEVKVRLDELLLAIQKMKLKG